MNRGIPKKIYLQWYGDSDETGPVDPGDVTWCQDRINERDPVYRLSSEHAPDFRALADDLAEALESVGTSLMLSSVVHPSYSGPWISEINAALAKYHDAMRGE